MALADQRSLVCRRARKESRNLHESNLLVMARCEETWLSANFTNSELIEIVTQYTGVHSGLKSRHLIAACVPIHIK